MSEGLSPAALDIVQNERKILRAFLRLEEFYRLADAEQRAAIREGWPFDRQWSIPGPEYSDMNRVIFAPLVGDDADGLDAQARIEARLTYHAIENARSDFRDSDMDIRLCYHAALRADLDILQILEEAATVCDDWMAGRMRGFTHWKPEAKSLWGMGYREVPFENGTAFEWIGFDKDYNALKPKHLDDMGREVRD